MSAYTNYQISQKKTNRKLNEEGIYYIKDLIDGNYRQDSTLIEKKVLNQIKTLIRGLELWTCQSRIILIIS